MAYAAPTVTAAGLIISTYQDILADNIQAYLNIYGQNQYVGTDSAIYQLLSILSLKQSDTNLGLQLAYNQSSPQTAVGAGLDRVVKMNGLAATIQLFYGDANADRHIWTSYYKWLCAGSIRQSLGAANGSDLRRRRYYEGHGTTPGNVELNPCHQYYSHAGKRLVQ